MYIEKISIEQNLIGARELFLFCHPTTQFLVLGEVKMSLFFLLE